MSSDEPYDPDGDVSRFLLSPGRDSHLIDVPEPEVTHPGGQSHHVPAVEAHPAVSMPDDAPAVPGFQGLTIEAGQHQEPMMFGLQAPTTDIRQYQAAAESGFQATPVGVEHEGYSAPVFGFNMEHHQTQMFHFQAPTMDVVEHQQQMPPPYGFQQASAMDVDHHQAPVFGSQHAPELDIEHHQPSAFGPQAPAMEDVVGHHQALAMDLVEHHQAPATDEVDHHLALAADVEHYQAPATDVQPQETPAPEEAYGVPDPTPELGPVVDNYSWVDEMLAEGSRLVIPPSSPPREEESAGNSAEDEIDLPPTEGFVYVPLVPGQLDCTRCRSVREVLHETDRRKVRFIVHSADQGAFEHAIMHRMSIAANGQLQTSEEVYVDFHNHTHGSVQDFIESSVKGLKKLGTGRLQDNAVMPNLIADGERATTGSSSQSVIKDNAPEASSQDAPLPVTQAEANNAAERNIKPEKWLGFTPDILESSHVQPYDPESGASVLLYPSMLEKIHERQQARVSNMTMEDASQMFEEIKEEAAREPDLSSMTFKRLCRKDSTYRSHSRRIKDLNRKIKNLVVQPAHSVSTSGLFSIQQKFLMYKQEKADLFAMIEMGLQEIEQDNDDGAAGPSGSH